LEAVERLHDVGGRLLATPNVDPEIIARARARGMVTMPGVITPAEASQRRGTWCLSFIENADRQRSAFMSFVNVWMAFNGWMAAVTERETDADLIRDFAANARLGKALGEKVGASGKRLE
jgi:hypothetical protein